MNPYLIIAAMIAVGSAYVYGHHSGYADRDAEMQAHIAKLNEESRAKEQELAANFRRDCAHAFHRFTREWA